MISSVVILRFIPLISNGEPSLVGSVITDHFRDFISSQRRWSVITDPTDTIKKSSLFDDVVISYSKI